MPRAAYQMPVRREKAERVGPRLWRKTILRPGHISKDGIELDVDRPYMESLIRSFEKGAKDQVQLVFANARNQHDESPERYRGSVVDLSVTDDERLEALVAVTPRGDKVLAENPDLGVSPSLLPGFARADGRVAENVLLHICGTLDPEIAGLGAWSRADLSADCDVVIDLSSAEVIDPATHAAAGSGGGSSHREGGAPVPTLTDEDRQLLSGVRELLSRFDEGGDTDEGADNKTGDKTGDKAGDKAAGKGKPGAEKNKGRKPTDDDGGAQDDTSDDDESDDDGDGADEQFTEEELAELAAGGVDQGAEDRELVNASAEHGRALELANSRIDDLTVRNARLEARESEREYEALKRQLAEQDGIPPRVTELCRPLLVGDGRVQLSAGKQTNARDLIVKALKEFAVVGALDLSAPIGTSHEADREKSRQAGNDEFLANAHKSGFAH